MIAAPTLPDKHDGELADHDGVRLWLRLLTCATTVEKILRRRFEGEFGTTLPRFDVLAALERRPDGTTMGALSRALLVSNGNVTGIVQKLADDGHVEVRSAPSDRRVSIARLTPAGRAHFARLAEAHRRWVDELMADLPEVVRCELHAGLGRLKASVAVVADREGK